MINEAIRESAGWDTICRCAVVLFGLTGAVTILVSLWTGNALGGFVGAISASLCWPCIHYASTIKQSNVSLRMLELALDQVESADQARDAINKAFASHYVRKESKNVVR